jgi:hypothetical protein
MIPCIIIIKCKSMLFYIYLSSPIIKEKSLFLHIKKQKYTMIIFLRNKLTTKVNINVILRIHNRWG